MKISELKVRNFRNLADLTIPLGHGTVIVGENEAGKSNLIQALRLLLDPTISSYDRTLNREDFWEGLDDGTAGWDPMEAGHRIEVTALITDLVDEPTALAAFGRGIVSSDPLTAKLKYQFAPREDIDQPESGPKKYSWKITAGDADEHVGSSVRNYLAHRHLSALRDVESDLANWRRSPLRSLLEAAVADISDGQLELVTEAFEAASSALTDLAPISNLNNSVSSEVASFSGPLRALDLTLDIVPPDPLRILRGLKIYLDGDARRSLSAASLGGLNILYLSLVQLLNKSQVDSNEIAHSIISIEEPEAHLHPHAQRVVFSRLSEGSESISTVVTTHSPHIVSVTPPKQLVVMRTSEVGSQAFAAADAGLTESEWDDVARYLDATRSELVFARKVLLVEGFAEQVIVPRLARASGVELDELGISICAVHGTHFTTYAKLLTQLRIPWAALTDGDPVDDDPDELAGIARAERIDEAIASICAPGWEAGEVFVGTTTLERDLFETGDGNKEACVHALAELMPSVDPEVEMDADTFFGKVKTRKGRFAQKLAGSGHDLTVPQYLDDALAYLGNR